MGRLKTPLYIMLLPEEKDRLASFSDQTGRAMSWVVRDALRVYLDAAEGDAEIMARIRSQMAAIHVDPSAVGLTSPEDRAPPYVR